jgi:hypothetical protein
VIKTKVTRELINFLEEDLIQNLNILGIIENEVNIEIYVDNIKYPRGVLVKNGYFNFIYTKEDSFINDFLFNYCKAEEYYGFPGIEEGIREKLRNHFTTRWENPCDLYYLPKENLNLALKKNKTSSINIKDADIINQHYAHKNKDSFSRIENNILTRPSSAIYLEDKIASWVLVHNDNSMGIMYTLEEYRGKGYAVDVTIDLCDKISKLGKIPFLQIIENNTMSPGLARKCGFIKYGRAIWFGGIKKAQDNS